MTPSARLFQKSFFNERSLFVAYVTCDGSLKPSGSLSSKADDSAVVHKTGDETIAGAKNFTGSLSVGGAAVVTSTDPRLTDQRTSIDASFQETGCCNFIFSARSSLFARTRRIQAYLYSKISPGWHSSALQIASKVESRIAFALPFFNTEMLAIVMPTLSASSVTLIFRFANITSMLIIIATPVSLYC